MDGLAGRLAALSQARPGDAEGAPDSSDGDDEALNPELGEARSMEKAPDACAEVPDLTGPVMEVTPLVMEEGPVHVDLEAQLAAKVQELEACTAKVRPSVCLRQRLQSLRLVLRAFFFFLFFLHLRVCPYLHILAARITSLPTSLRLDRPGEQAHHGPSVDIARDAFSCSRASGASGGQDEGEAALCTIGRGVPTSST